MKYVILYTCLAVFIFSCGSDDNTVPPEVIDLEYTQEEKEVEIALIKKYIDDNRVTNAKETLSGLHYIIEKPGQGLTPAEEDIIVFYFKTTNLNTGEILGELTPADSKYGTTSPLYNLLPGVREGFLLVNEGAIITLFVPSYLAYGKQGNFNGEIKPKTILKFTMELNLVLKR